MNNFSDFNNSNQNQDFMKNMMNENFINMANNIDLDNLNGTSIMDLNNNNNNNNPQISLPSFNMPNNLPSMNNFPQINQNFEPKQDKQLIKSITKELINNLKENNISLHDDTEGNTYYSKYNKSSKNNNKNINYDTSVENEDYCEDIEEKINKNKKIKKNKRYDYKEDFKRGVEKGIENMISETGVPVSSNFSSYIFDDLFNLKEVIILFSVYFLLSQEMVKDLFAQYFTSLNPDDTGRVNVKGVIIYGLILTVLYMVLKKIL